MVPIHEIYLARCAAKAVVSPTTSSLATALALGDALAIAGLLLDKSFFVGLFWAAVSFLAAAGFLAFFTGASDAAASAGPGRRYGADYPPSRGPSQVHARCELRLTVRGTM